jgi:hypothetical protein
MRPFLLATALAVLPLAACTQGAHADDGNGPSPEVQAKLTQVRGAARDASFKDLSSDHQAKVHAIVDAFDGGSTELADAAQQIDAVLTPAESQAVLAEQAKMRDAIRQAMTQDGSSGGFQGHREGQGGGRRPPDAGRFLLTVTASADKLREAMHRPAQ